MINKNKMILVFKTSVRTMHTTNNAITNLSADPQRISAFASEMLKWENPAIDLSQGVNYCGIKSIAIFFKKIGYDSFISFFDTSKTGARFISSKLENIGSRINFKLENFNFDSLSHSNLSISFKSLCLQWSPYRPEGFIKESLFFLFQHWHITSVVVGATAYFIYMHFFTDANDSISASSEEHISDDGSVGSDNAASQVVDRLSPPTVVGVTGGSGGAVESKEVAALSVDGVTIDSTAVTLLSLEYTNALKLNILNKLEKSIIRRGIIRELSCFLNTSDLSEEIMNVLTPNILDILDRVKCRLDENFNLIFNGFVKKNCGGAVITSETTAFVNKFLTKAPVDQHDFNQYILIELETLNIPSIIKPVIKTFILTTENLNFTRFTESTFRGTFKIIVFQEVCSNLDFYLLNAKVINILQPYNQDKLHNIIKKNINNDNFDKLFMMFIKNNYEKWHSDLTTTEEFRFFLYNLRPGDLSERIDFLFSLKKEMVNYFCKRYINQVFNGFFTFNDIYDGTTFKKVNTLSPPTTVGATGGSGGGGAVEAKEPEVLSGGES